MYRTCSENGQSLVEQCDDTPARADLEARLGKLQSEWKRLGQLFGEVLQKLSDALIQVWLDVHIWHTSVCVHLAYIDTALHVSLQHLKCRQTER